VILQSFGKIEASTIRLVGHDTELVTRVSPQSYTAPQSFQRLRGLFHALLLTFYLTRRYKKRTQVLFGHRSGRSPSLISINPTHKLG